jgi:hypothetical protein
MIIQHIVSLKHIWEEEEEEEKQQQQEPRTIINHLNNKFLVINI